MSRPLELVVYPKNADGDYLLPLANGRQMLVRYEQADGYGEYGCRLTDAELAAEYWSAAAVVESALRRGSGLVAPLSDERNTLHRFATHPHYDEGEQ